MERFKNKRRSIDEEIDYLFFYSFWMGSSSVNVHISWNCVFRGEFGKYMIHETNIFPQMNKNWLSVMKNANDVNKNIFWSET
jgi:hypothetical protein